MYIERVEQITDEIFAALVGLIPYIDPQKAPPTRDEMVSLVESKSSTLWMAKYPDQNGEIAGFLTIALYRVPTGLRSIVEDVVVEPAFRRRGVARALLHSAIEFARAAGAGGVAMTSNPRREAANQLYLSLGFEQRETNSYYYRL